MRVTCGKCGRTIKDAAGKPYVLAWRNDGLGIRTSFGTRAVRRGEPGESATGVHGENLKIILKCPGAKCRGDYRPRMGALFDAFVRKARVGAREIALGVDVA